LALIVAGGALLTTLLNGWQIRRGKAQDYERQDAVAAQAAEAAALLLASQKASIERTNEVARLAAEADTRTAEKLDAIDAQGKVIHSLVNQKLTNVTQQALLATMALLPHLEEAVARMRAGGVAPPAADLRRLEETKRSIADLRATLEQRTEKQAEVDADAKVAETSDPRFVRDEEK
jgi:hypothetical protein